MHRNIYRGVYHQRGNGVGSVLSGLFRLLTPFIKRGAQAALKSQPVRRALASAKKSAIKTATVAASDLIAGRNIKENVKHNLKEAQQDIEKALLNEQGKSPAKKPRVLKRANLTAPPSFVVPKKTGNNIPKKKTIPSLI